MIPEVYVTDLVNQRVQVFDLNGVYKRKWGSKGSGNGYFNYPWGISIYKSEVFVSDRFNYRIQVFDLNGVYKRKWGSYGSGDLQFKDPSEVFIPRGKIDHLPIIGVG